MRLEHSLKLETYGLLIGVGEMPTVPETNKQLVVMGIGASLMQGIFEDEEQIEQMFADKGIIAKVFEAAVGGNTTTTILANSYDYMADLDKREGYKLVPVHAGGNNASRSPYPIESTIIHDDLSTLYPLILSHGAELIPANISYRIPPASNPVEEYNSEVVIPLAIQYAPRWFTPAGVPMFNMYQWTLDDPDGSSDGIHRTDESYDEFAQKVVDFIAANVIQTITPRQYITDAIVRFSVDGYRSDFMGLRRNQVSFDYQTIDIHDVDGIPVAGATITAGNFYFDQSGYSSSGAYQMDLTNSAVMKGNASITTEQTVIFSADCFNPSASYEISVTGSRVTSSTTRVGDYTIAGVTKQIQGSTSYTADGKPEIITWVLTPLEVQDLITNGLVIKPADGHTNAYLSGIRVRKL
ncbi:SGNH hydrolase-type esterase domain protein [Vibrio phage 1.049.O._10N.286.54.B5]|nr:SGNH hydrolase-type esterase domain protein [Vibrio phage 1.049.O._10N.286.54.B5]